MARDFSLSIDRGFLGHPKTLRFCRLMGSELAFGTLIKLWSWAIEAAPEGDIRVYDPADIEWAVGHRDGDGRCFKALCDAGFIEHDTYKPTAIHDWMEPGHTGYALVKQKSARDRWRRNKGLPVESSPSDADEPAAHEEPREDSARNSAGTSRESTVLHGSRFTVHGSQEEFGVVRAPAIPDGPYTGPKEGRRPLDRFAAATSAPFRRVFLAYPRKDAEIPASHAFQLAAQTFPGGEEALATAMLAAFPALLKRAPYNGPNEKRPFLEKVIAEWRWQDPASAPDPVPPVDKSRAGPSRDIRVGTMRAEENVHLKSGVQE